MENLLTANTRAPRQGDKVYKDQCVYCFHNPKFPGGLYICLDTYLGFCCNHVKLYATKSGKKVYLNLKQVLKPKSETDLQGDDPPKKKPTKVAIGVDGGFDVDDVKVDYEDIYTLVVLHHDEENTVFQLSDPSIPEQLQLAITGIISFNTSAFTEQVTSWGGEKRKVSKYAQNLTQLENVKKIPPSGWKCSKCDLTQNLWLNLTDGSILCGRKFYDGSGGNNHAVDHYKETGYPLCVKLGTITQSEADIFSYAEDDMVEDPLLAKHLAHFGINITLLEKTDQTMTELEVEKNMQLKSEFDSIQESGKKLKSVYGAGYTGITNLGNSCYMNSVVQVLFSLPEFNQRYSDAHDRIFRNTTSQPCDDFNVQMSKLGHGLSSGDYSKPPKTDGTDEENYAVNELNTISPHMFKSLVGKGHVEFSTNYQQDAQEFLLHLFGIIDKSQRTSQWTENPVDNFRYKVEERIQCIESKKVSYKYREDSMWSLAIPMDEVVNKVEYEEYERVKKEREESKEKIDCEEVVRPVIPLTACIKRFTSDEIIEDFYSTALQRKSSVKKTTRFATFPNYLVIHMRKFTIGDDWVPKKLDVAFQVDDVIDINELRGSGLQPDEDELPVLEEEPPNVAPVIDESVVEQLTAMGFSSNACRRAVFYTGNHGAEAAMNWIFEHQTDEDFNNPLPDTAAKTSTSETVNEESCAMLMSMGFNREQAIKSLKMTDGNLERAADWIFSHAAEIEQMETDVSVDTGPHCIDGDGKYQLVALISHMGTSTSCGHYVCHIRKDERWIIYNDRKVAVSENPPRRLAYMYFYKRIPTPSPTTF